MAAIAGAGILFLIVPPRFRAQAAAGSGAEQPIATAQSVVPASLTITKDSASVSGAAPASEAAPPPYPYQSPAAASGAPAPPSATQASLPPHTFPPGATMMTMPPGGVSAEVKATIDEL
ncbi:MAG: hypothetical protein ABSG46_15710, partial [Candidatus Binataceae bacterium]